MFVTFTRPTAVAQLVEPMTNGSKLGLKSNCQWHQDKIVERYTMFAIFTRLPAAVLLVEQVTNGPMFTGLNPAANGTRIKLWKDKQCLLPLQGPQL
jgi:hypothetical protein